MSVKCTYSAQALIFLDSPILNRLCGLDIKTEQHFTMNL